MTVKEFDRAVWEWLTSGEASKMFKRIMNTKVCRFKKSKSRRKEQEE
jgi:hypothetical protein